ncbi:MAG TPA: hypothetical protein PKB09_03980 [Candidatus Saccharibacteria bacterium]|nr:hypothetical protein [Candidatus Saccharibacteria bacterium]
MLYRGAEFLPDEELNSLARDLVCDALETHREGQDIIGKRLANDWGIDRLIDEVPHGVIVPIEDYPDLATLRLHTDILDEDIPDLLLKDDSYTYFDHFTGHVVQAVNEALPQNLSMRTSRLIKPIIVPRDAGEQFYAIRRQDLLKELNESGFVELFDPLDQSATSLGIYAARDASRLALQTQVSYLKPVSIHE